MPSFPEFLNIFFSQLLYKSVCISLPLEERICYLSVLHTACKIYVNKDLEVESDTGSGFYVRNWSSNNINTYLQYIWFFTYFYFTKTNGCKMEAAALNSTLGVSSLPKNDSIPATIPGASLVTDSISQITEPVVASPVATQPPLSATELGFLPTPDFRPLICMVERENEKVHDSDGEMGPFYDLVYDEAPLLCDNEAEVGTELLL